MKPRSNIIRIDDWTFNPAKRAHRFRCAACSKLVEDGTDLVLERHGKRSTGWHAHCFDNTEFGALAKQREAERLDPRRNEWRYPNAEGL